MRHPTLPLTREQTAQVYRTLKWIHTHLPLNFQLGMDEDFGTSGIEVMEFPPHTGWCQAGRQLFAVVPYTPVLGADTGETRLEQIGNIAACVDAFKPVCGRLLRKTDKLCGDVSYDLEFFHDVIGELNNKRLDGTYRDGCFAPEMLHELRQISAELAQ